MTPEEKESQPPLVTIVVSPRERFEQAIMSLEACLETADVPFDLIYVDGGTPKSIATPLRQAVEQNGHAYIRREGYLTPNSARNIALPWINTRYVAFIDNDVIFQPGWLSALVQCAEETGAGLVTPVILVGPAARMPNMDIHHAGGILKLEEGPEGKSMYRRHGYEHLPYLDHKDELKREETDSTEFHVVLARKDMLDDIGPFDLKLVGFTDEIDMAFSAKAKGWKIYFEPTSVVAYAVGKALTWRDRPYFCVRWAQGRVMRAEKYFYQKWGLAPDFERQKNFLRDHRRHAFPMKRLQKYIGWRATVALTMLLCETTAFLASVKFIRPDLSPKS